jgi:hypothetical protein
MKDKYTKSPTVWELAQAFPDCRDIAARVARNDGCPYAKRFLRMTRSGVNNKQLDIESARAVKIQDMHDFGKVRKTGKRIQVCCPLHEDKNPSFIIYTDSNSWHCFSCNRGGSVIDFIMHLQGKTFVQAVKYLNGE